VADNGFVLSLAGSPRSGGNTGRLMSAFLEGLLAHGLEGEKFCLSELEISPCLHCGGCAFTGKCVVEDDMEIIYRELARADVLVLASPVFFTSVTAQTKAVIDRCQCLWVAKERLGKPFHEKMRPGCFISAAGQDIPTIFDCTLKVVKSFFNTVSFSLAVSVLEPGLDEMGDLETRPETLEKAREKGDALGKELLYK
jgi:multimeric flavodoxin WrbA